MRIDQLVPSFAAHDAIGNHVLELRSVFRAHGYASDIFAEHIDPRVSSEASAFADCPPRTAEERVVLYQSSTDSAMVPWIADQARAGTPVVSNYHNITPASYFDRWEPRAAASMRRARQELADLAPSVGLALSDSDFNTAELVDLGYRDASTSPLLLDLDGFRERPEPRLLGRLQRLRDQGVKRWLFVGRLAPNKCQHDVIAAFALFHRLYGPQARLTLIGSAAAPRYATALRHLARELDIEDAVEFATGVPAPELRAYFATADVFVCQSEHEGFCVPIVEAMVSGVPVVAHGAAAVPDTVGDAGVLLDDKDPLSVAVAVLDLLDDPARRDDLVARARARAQRFELATTSADFLRRIETWLSHPAGGGEPPAGP